MKKQGATHHSILFAMDNKPQAVQASERWNWQSGPLNDDASSNCLP
jgi:hypothetical protein